MKLFEVNYGIWANPTLIIITANNKREARKIAKDHNPSTEIKAIKQIDISKPRVIMDMCVQ